VIKQFVTRSVVIKQFITGFSDHLEATFPPQRLRRSRGRSMQPRSVDAAAVG